MTGDVSVRLCCFDDGRPHMKEKFEKQTFKQCSILKDSDNIHYAFHPPEKNSEGVEVGMLLR